MISRPKLPPKPIEPRAPCSSLYHYDESELSGGRYPLGDILAQVPPEADQNSIEVEGYVDTYGDRILTVYWTVETPNPAYESQMIQYGKDMAVYARNLALWEKACARIEEDIRQWDLQEAQKRLADAERALENAKKKVQELI